MDGGRGGGSGQGAGGTGSRRRRRWTGGWAAAIPLSSTGDKQRHGGRGGIAGLFSGLGDARCRGRAPSGVGWWWLEGGGTSSGQRNLLLLRSATAMRPQSSHTWHMYPGVRVCYVLIRYHV